MTTSQEASTLVSPSGEEAIPLGTLGYFRARHRGSVHDLVLREFEESGISKATLARRMSKRPEVISRLLGGAGNWTLDTVSDLLFAIRGGEPEYQIAYPLSGTQRRQQPQTEPRLGLRFAATASEAREFSLPRRPTGALSAFGASGMGQQNNGLTFGTVAELGRTS